MKTYTIPDKTTAGQYAYVGAMLSMAVVISIVGGVWAVGKYAVMSGAKAYRWGAKWYDELTGEREIV